MLQKQIRNLLLCGGLICSIISVGCGAKVGGFKTFGPKVGLSSTAINSAKYSNMSEAEKDTLVDEAIMTKLSKVPDSTFMSGNFAIKKVAIISAPFTVYYDHNSPGLLGLGLGEGSKVVSSTGYTTTYRSEYLDNLNAEQRTAIADKIVETYANALKRQGFEVVHVEKVINSSAFKNKGTKPELPNMSPKVNVTDGVGLREKPALPSHPTGFKDYGMMGTYNLLKDRDWGNAIAKELGVDGLILLDHTIEWNLYGTGSFAIVTLITNFGRWEAAYSANAGDPYEIKYSPGNNMVMGVDVGRTSGGPMMTVGEGKDIRYRVADSIIANIEPVADQLARAMRKHYPQPETGKIAK